MDSTPLILDLPPVLQVPTNYQQYHAYFLHKTLCMNRLTQQVWDRLIAVSIPTKSDVTNFSALKYFLQKDRLYDCLYNLGVLDIVPQNFEFGL